MVENVVLDVLAYGAPTIHAIGQCPVFRANLDFQGDGYFHARCHALTIDTYDSLVNYWKLGYSPDMDDEKPVSDTLLSRIEQAIAEGCIAQGAEREVDFAQLARTVHTTISAGADFDPVEEGIELTPAQALAYLLDLRADQRLQVMGRLLLQSGQGNTCFLMQHEATIEQLREQLAAIPTLPGVRPRWCVRWSTSPRSTTST